MKNGELPARKDIEELAAYLPRLFADGFPPILSWGGGEKPKDGSISMPYPNYNPLVEEFFRFGGGLGADMIEKGYVRRILERLNKIKSEMK